MSHQLFNIEELTEVPQGQARLAARMTSLPDTVSAEAKSRFAKMQSTAVIGSGAMGRCIAIALLNVGKQVLLIDSHSESLALAKKFISGYFASQVKKGRLDEAKASLLMGQIAYQQSWDGLESVQLVVEAVPESMELKQQIMRQLEATVAPDTVLATNTSTLDLDAIAGAVEHSERVVGTHFFIPAHITKLLELVPAKQTSSDTLELVKAMALAMRKVFVVAGNCDGFIGNRLFDRFHQEAMYLIEEGATPEQVDRVLEGWGMAIGPFRALDMVGNDIPWPVRRNRALLKPDLIQPRICDAICEEGRYGQKTGSGWYRYEEGSREPQVSEETQKLMERISTELGLVRRKISDSEVLERSLLALINEGSTIVREGFAQDQTDIDLVYVNGYGFPAAMGGPMALKDTLGARAICDRVNHYAAIAQYGARLWTPDAALQEEAK